MGQKMGREKCDHYARGECDPSLSIFPGLGYAHYRWHGKIISEFICLLCFCFFLVPVFDRGRYGTIAVPHNEFNNNNKRPLTPKSMPPAGDEHAKLKT